MRKPHSNWSEEYRVKLILPTNLKSMSAKLKDSGCSIVTLNGSFDLLHAGHLQIIYEASQQADILLVALNSDESIKRYKGSCRPIITLEYRLQMMAALNFVDYVTWFEEDDPINLINIVQPTIHVNGSEYGTDCIEATAVHANQGRLYICQKIPGLSTSELISKIKSLEPAV